VTPLTAKPPSQAQHDDLRRAVPAAGGAAYLPMKKVIILGAAGRDFHNFNVLYRHDPEVKVVAFTATQIPDIAGRSYPPALAGPLYPLGIPIVEEAELEQLIAQKGIDEAVFSYSDVAHVDVMHLASRVVAAGANFVLAGKQRTQLKSKLPVISICAVRTGCGKSPATRRIAAELRELGWHPVVIRHPMPYGDLEAQACQRFSCLQDLERNHCTIEEREEYEPHLEHGTIVYAGVDYRMILDCAEMDGDIILWDGGNNDTSFYRSDLEFVVLDSHRVGHESSYYPGEVNFRSANVLIINKVDSANQFELAQLREHCRTVNPNAIVVEAACRIDVPNPELLHGKTALVIEDGPTLTHGGMAYGAGVIGARNAGVAHIVDPRPYAVGSIRETFHKYGHLSQVLPAMGYSPTQRRELQQTIEAVPCDVVVIATPIDLTSIIAIQKPTVRVSYEMEALTCPGLREILGHFSHTHRPSVMEVAHQ
jgi:predicted GTPase